MWPWDNKHNGNLINWDVAMGYQAYGNLID